MSEWTNRMSIKYLWSNKITYSSAAILLLYDSTLYASEHFAILLYETLCSTITVISWREKLIILGDFSTCVGKDNETWDAIVYFGTEKVYSNWLRLLELFFEFSLSICNTFFHQKIKQKVTLYYFRFKYRLLSLSQKRHRLQNGIPWPGLEMSQIFPEISD